jgi:hypothetical protein
MTTQQQINSLRTALDRVEALADKIKEALAADDPAAAEVELSELITTVAAANTALDDVTAATDDEPPEQPGDRGD